MKYSALLLGFLLCIGYHSLGFAQDLELPEPISEAQTQVSDNTDNSISDEVAPGGDAAEGTSESSESGEDPASEAENQAPPQTAIAQQMIAFFDGLDAAISAQNGNCQAMSDAFVKYCTEHRDWIQSLDYATVNLDAKTMDEIHQKSIEFGKKLSVCYEQTSIPNQLRKLAGIEAF